MARQIIFKSNAAKPSPTYSQAVKAVGADYDALHAAMEQVGFSRFITGDNGHTYHMPWAEYNGSGNLTSVQVRDIARTAANTTGKGNAVLVRSAQSVHGSASPPPDCERVVIRAMENTAA